MKKMMDEMTMSSEEMDEMMKMKKKFKKRKKKVSVDYLTKGDTKD
jgi:hypothetical protein